MSDPAAASASGASGSASPPLMLPFQPPPGTVPFQYVDPATGKTFVVFQSAPAGAVPVGALGAAPDAAAGAGAGIAAVAVAAATAASVAAATSASAPGAAPAAMVITPPSQSPTPPPAAAAAPAAALSVDAAGANASAMVDDAPGAGTAVPSKPPSPSHSDAGGRERGSSSGSLVPPGSNRGGAPADRASPPPAIAPGSNGGGGGGGGVSSAALAVSPGASGLAPFAHHHGLSLSSAGSGGVPKGSPLSASPQPKPVRPDIKEMPTIKLASTSKERAYYDNLSDLFSIVVTMEHLEKAYVRESIEVDEYTKSCKQLLAQFKTCKEALRDLTDMEKFYRDYHLESCRQAIQRLREGVPATVLHGGDGASAGAKASQLHVFHAVQHFITTMDSLKLEQRAVDELHPNLSDLMNSLNKVVSLPPEHDAKAKVKQWLLTLGQMKAHDELSGEQVRQMSFDLENAYNAFHRFVEAEKK